MALFKILKGQEKNLPANKTEGWAYVTTDEGNMYVDVSASKRVRIGAHADKADVATKAEGDTKPIREIYLAKLKQVTSNGTTFSFRGETGNGTNAPDLISIPLAGDKAGLISNAAQTIKGLKTFNDGLHILGAAADTKFWTRGIVGATSDGSAMEDLYLQYGNNISDTVYFGVSAGGNISNNGTQYSGNAATATIAEKAKGDTTSIRATYIHKIKQVASNGTTFTFRGEYGDGSNANDLITIPAASSSIAGLITTGAQTIAGNKTFANGLIVSATSGFNYSGIEAGTADSVRPIWFSDANKSGTPVINSSKFTYNPYTNRMVVGNITLNGKDIASNYLTKVEKVDSIKVKATTGDGTSNTFTLDFLPLAGGTMTGAINFDHAQKRIISRTQLNSTTVNSGNNANKLTLPTNDNVSTGLMIHVANGNNDFGVFYLSEDTAFIANSGDTGYVFKVIDKDTNNGITDYNDNVSTMFAVKQGSGGVIMRGPLEPLVTESQNIGSTAMFWNNVYAKYFKGIADRATSDSINQVIADTYIKSIAYITHATQPKLKYTKGSGGTTELNMPIASATNAGLITNAAQTIAGDKTFTGMIYFPNATSGLAKGIQWTVGDNDYARIRAGATASNNGYLEIATADDATEPIYVRQYTGVFATLKRTLTLLDANGNTRIPGSLYDKNNQELRANLFLASLFTKTSTGTQLTIGGKNTAGTELSTITIPNASTSVAGIITNSDQSIKGTKTLDDGMLIIKPVGRSNYQEGIRILAANDGWTTLAMGGSATSGTNASIWSMHTYQSNFYITHNGSNSSSTGILQSDANGHWRIDNSLGIGGKNAAYKLYVNGTSLHTNTININPNTVAIDFRHDNNSCHSTISYQTYGDEALVFANKYPYTSFLFVTNEDSVTNHANNRWNSLTNTGLQIKENCVQIGGLWRHGVHPDYKLKVNGTSYFTNYLQTASYFKSTVATGTAPIQVASTTLNTNLNADLLDGWHKQDILGTYYVTSNTAGLSHYWCRIWRATITSQQYNDTGISIYVQSQYNNKYGLFTWKLRQNGANNSGAYSFTTVLLEHFGNIDSTDIRLYYDNATGICEVWVNCWGQYGVWNYSVLKKCHRTNQDSTSIGGFYSNNFNTAQTMPTSSYITASYTPFLGNAATATNADKVDGYHASQLWRSDGAVWNPNANVVCSGSNAEWSFDINSTGGNSCWHVWSSNQGRSMLACYPESSHVAIPVHLHVGGYNHTGYALSTSSFICGDWIRTAGNTGWYNESYGGGIYMVDSTWIRTYNGKNFYCDATMGSGAHLYTDGYFRCSGASYTYGHMYVGSNNKVHFWEDGEGGNIQIIAPNGREVQMDMYDSQNFRIYSWNDAGAYVGISMRRSDGHFFANAVHNAVWNDYAECREADTKEPGRVLFEKGDDTLGLTNQRLQAFAGVSSDTYGVIQGETEKAKTPLAVAGRVLVYPYQDRNNYKPGDCVCAAPGGTVDIMTRDEIAMYPDRIVGTVSCVPEYEEWGTGNAKVNGRIWIKVR